MDVVRDDPLNSFLYGLFFFIAFAIVVFALLISIVGIPVLFVLGPLIAIAWLVGVSIAFLAIADRLVDHEDGWLVPLLLAAGPNGGLTLTGIGGLVALLIGVAGFGAVVYDALD